MSYQSPIFLLFSALAILFYYCLGRKRQKHTLLFFNILFYVFAGIQYIPFLLATLCASFFAGRCMGKRYEILESALAQCDDAFEKKALRESTKKENKKVLMLGFIVPIALLIVCKYTSFALQNINFILDMAQLPQITIFRMIVPLGISFYTFMAISYLLDIYWKRYSAEKDFVTYAVYLTYFPHIIQGPIDRFNRFKEQIKDGQKLNYQNLTYGAQLVIWGFFKKLVIADRLGVFVSEIYDNYQQYTGVIFVIATVLYSIQIYADFSGCIDIVLGISEMLGIKLEKNFYHPYFAKGMPEFWRRWHISLGEWFKDYIYYPVSTSGLVKKVKKHYKVQGKTKQGELFASCFPAMVVWLITGIWHGAAWKYVAWGIFHAILIIGSNIFSPKSSVINKKLGIRTESFSWQFWQMTRTFILCCIGRVFFRAEDLNAAIHIFLQTFESFSPQYIVGGELYTYGLERADFQFALISILVLWIVDMLQERMKIRDALAKQNIIFRWIIIYTGIFAVLIFGMYGAGYNASDFIYGQF